MKTTPILTAALACVSSLFLSSCGESEVSGENQAATSPIVSVDATGAKWAPEPAHEFTNTQCETAPSKTPHFPQSPGLYISEINAESPLQKSSELVFPAAPAGIWWSQSAPFASNNQGATVTAGHVDHAPGEISPEGGELSAFWGNLHRAEVDECTHIFVTDFELNHHEYVITDKYTIRQENLANNTQALTHQGLTLITCSGKTLEDVGKENQFNYENNLSIEAEKISRDSNEK